MFLDEDTARALRICQSAAKRTKVASVALALDMQGDRFGRAFLDSALQMLEQTREQAAALGMSEAAVDDEIATMVLLSALTAERQVAAR